MFVIGVAGQAQNGKDTLSDRLAEQLNRNGKIWQRAAFAAAVKKVFCDAFGVDLEFVEKWKTNPEPPPGFNVSVRKALQFIGDGFRNIQPNVWMNIAFRDKSEKIILSDVRYINEFSRIYHEGGLNILVARPGMINYDDNESEAQIRPYAEWCLRQFENFPEKVILLSELDWERYRGENLDDHPPEKMEMFHIFVCNCGDTDELYDEVDTVISKVCEDFFLELLNEEL